MWDKVSRSVRLCQYVPLGYDCCMSSIASNRKAKGLTQKALAQALGVTQMTVSNWENGRRQASVAMLRKVADVLGVPVAKLLD